MNSRKRSIIFFSFLLILSLLFAVLVLQKHSSNHKLRAQIARDFLITDLCLTTEARHTRRLSQPDLLTPFQDFPGGLDRFPSSSFLAVPASSFRPLNAGETQ